MTYRNIPNKGVGWTRTKMGDSGTDMVRISLPKNLNVFLSDLQVKGIYLFLSV